MNDLIIFENVRCKKDENENPMLNLEDVARGLGFTTVAKSGNDCVRWSRVEEYLQSFGFSQLVGKDTFIPENIFYKLCFKANNETAMVFQDKVTDVILPSIRKHGIYATDKTLDKMMNNPDFMLEIITLLKEEKTKRELAENKNAILMHTNKVYSAIEIAKELNMKSAAMLNKILKDMRIQYTVNETWVLYTDYANCGYTSIKQTILDSDKEVYTRYFTQLGREFILDLLKDRVEV